MADRKELVERLSAMLRKHGCDDYTQEWYDATVGADILAELATTICESALVHANLSGRISGMEAAHQMPCGCIHGDCYTKRHIAALKHQLAKIKEAVNDN